MANFIEATNLFQTNFVTPLSRYVKSQIYRYGDEKKLTFEIYKRKPKVLSPNDVFTVIAPQYQYRPDLLANKVYGDPEFWWVIMEANDIFDIFDFKAGLNIRLPATLLR